MIQANRITVALVVASFLMLTVVTGATRICAQDNSPATSTLLPQAATETLPELETETLLPGEQTASPETMEKVDQAMSPK